MSYHITTNDVHGKTLKRANAKAISQEDYILRRIFSQRVDHGWTSDEVYRYLTDQLKVRFEHKIKAMINAQSAPDQLLSTIDQEFEKRVNRKGSVKRALSDLVERGDIYRSADTRRAQTGRPCHVYYLKTKK